MIFKLAIGSGDRNACAWKPNCLQMWESTGKDLADNINPLAEIAI